MNVHDDPALDVELDLLRAAPAPRVQLREHILANVAREALASAPARVSTVSVPALAERGVADASEAFAQHTHGRAHAEVRVANTPNGAAATEAAHHATHGIGPSRLPGERETIHRAHAFSWRDALAAFWHELGGARLAAPAFALALAFGIGLSWVAEDSAASADASGDDLVALAQFDDAYEGLEP